MRDSREFDTIMKELQADEHVQQMKKYRQHGRITTYDHCADVARLCWKINNKLHLHADRATLVKGAMLHDFYLYDWHSEDNGEHHWHGYIHAEKARKNAVELLAADEKVQHVIYSHMWPLNLTRVPRSLEAWIVCLADKYVSLKETVMRR